MTIDWFARWGAERRLAWGRWKMVCCGWWVDWAQWEKPARAKQAPAAVRNSQIRHKRARPRRSCSLVELPKRWTGRPKPRRSRCFPTRRQQSMVPSWTSVSVGLGRRVEAWGIEGSGSPTWWQETWWQETRVVVVFGAVRLRGRKVLPSHSHWWVKGVPKREESECEGEGKENGEVVNVKSEVKGERAGENEKRRHSTRMGGFRRDGTRQAQSQSFLARHGRRRPSWLGDTTGIGQGQPKREGGLPRGHRACWLDCGLCP